MVIREDSESNHRLCHTSYRRSLKYFVLLRYRYLDIKWNANQLRYVRIYFDSPTFDRFTKDRAAKFVDMLSAIGGTMGLLTGFSIISGVEILYFVGKNIVQLFKTNKKEI